MCLIIVPREISFYYIFCSRVPWYTNILCYILHFVCTQDKKHSLCWLYKAQPCFGIYYKKWLHTFVAGVVYACLGWRHVIPDQEGSAILQPLFLLIGLPSSQSVIQADVCGRNMNPELCYKCGWKREKGEAADGERFKPPPTCCFSTENITALFGHETWKYIEMCSWWRMQGHT